MDWVLIRSWHAIRTYTRVSGGVITLCGRHVQGREIRPSLPAERSCETCLRIVARKADG